MMGPSVGKTSHSTRSETCIPARQARPSRQLAGWSTKGRHFFFCEHARLCSCLFKAQCCPNTPFRRIQHSIYEEARDVARALAKTEAFEQSRRDRKRVEML